MPGEKSTGPPFQTIVDGMGRTLKIPQHPSRVISLSPAVTEMLFTLLDDSQIIAVSPNCNFPLEKVKNKPKIENYPLDFESILKAKPDLIISEEGITSIQDAEKLQQLGLPLVLFKYRKSSDVVVAMDSISKWMNVSTESKARVADLYLKLKAQTEKYANRGIESRPKVLAITWIDPIFAYGFDTWMSDKIWLAGGINALNQKLDKPYPTLQREVILKLNPDFIFGGTFEKMDSTFFVLYPELKRTTAYKKKQVFELNDDLASRPGPRILDGIFEIERFLESEK
jgi:iron complex transport system substrate-binding protein